MPAVTCAFPDALRISCPSLRPGHSHGHVRGVGLSSTRWSLLPHTAQRQAQAVRLRASSAEAAPSAPDEAVEFDWKLGLALAGCAFEAYNGLEEDDEGPPPLRQVSASGTQVTYVDQAFVSEKMAGLLEVTVVGATGLKASDVSAGV